MNIIKKKNETKTTNSKASPWIAYSLNFDSIGLVITLTDGIAQASGLNNIQYGEMVKIGRHSIPGMALNLANDHVGILILGGARSINVGDYVKRTKSLMRFPIQKNFRGRVVDAVGNMIDGSIDASKSYWVKIDTKAVGIIPRGSINRPLQTGLLTIDAITPIGCGQRELIIGDRKTGKTSIAIDTILHQSSYGSMYCCIYVAVGQKRSSVAKIMDVFTNKKCKSLIISATASDPAALQFLAPYSGCAVGEFLSKSSCDALVIYDDLSKQAVAYRQISLLLRRPPGREAFPGDVFYLHSRLLERAVNFSSEYGSGSLTALPIIETQLGDVSAYIPTNVISITDGQIFLEADLFNKGIRPAINVSLSVSRIGAAAQVKSIKKLAHALKIELAQYREVEAFESFASELDPTTQFTIIRGSRLVQLLKQPHSDPLRVEQQVLCLFAGLNGYFDNIALKYISDVKWYILYAAERLDFFNTFDVTKEVVSDIFTSFLDILISRVASGNKQLLI